MLNPHYTYCFLDFETTGLSHERDDVIQVGLIITDSNLGVLNYFSSFVNPGYEIDKLKTIVTYTTGISPEQIMNGISLDAFKQKMIELIPNNTVFVGHNIAFDIKFLKKYLSNSELRVQNSELRTIDTLDRAKALIHYPASFSLDILYPIIREQFGVAYFISLSQKVGQDDIRNHDALSDCLICIALLEYCLKKMQGICSSFPVAKKIIAKSGFWFLDIHTFDQLKEQALSEKVPLLDFPVKSDSSHIIDKELDRKQFPDGTKLYYGDQPIEQLIRQASGLGKYILSTNSKQKLTIIKSKCKAMGLHDVSFMKEQQQVDRKKLNKVFSKTSLDEREGRFFLKYCSHKLQGLGLLDLNTSGDYKVYNYVREDSKSDKSDMMLITHSALFSLLEQEEYKDYVVLFLDHERRYNSYLKYVSTPRDPINFARVVDNYVYEYGNDNDIRCLSRMQQLMNLVDMFCGILSMEITRYIGNKKIDSQGRYEIGVISGNQEFLKTNDLYQKIAALLENIKNNSIIYAEDMLIIIKQFEKLQHYLENIISVTPIISDYTSYNFHMSNNFVDYSEFAQLFDGYQHYFLSNRNHTFRPLVNTFHTFVQSTKTHSITEIATLEDIKTIVLQDKVFVLNNNPIKAKKLFEFLQTGQRGKDYKILVENVTGGRGKNIALSKNQDKLILIGGYEMALQCMAEKIMPSQILIYEKQGLLHQQIIADLQYWMK